MSEEKMKNYTRIYNKVLEELAKIKLSPTQYRLIMVIWRYTYGFNRSEHDMSLRFLSNATGCDSRQIQRELKKLEQKKIIFQNIKSGSYRKISFNHNVHEWVGDTTIGDTTVGETTNGGIDNVAIGEIDNGWVGETTKGTIGEITNQERNSLKKPLNTNLKKESIPYSEIINYLNEKAGKNFRSSTDKTKKLIKARWNEGFELNDFKKVIDTKVSQWKHNPKMNPYLRPQTLFGTKFEAYLNEQAVMNNVVPMKKANKKGVDYDKLREMFANE